MSRKYRIQDLEGLYFVSFATVGWVDLFIWWEYKDILVDSLKHCQAEKGLLIYEWTVMMSHVHLLVKSAGPIGLSDILRDLKKFTSKQLVKAIELHPQESRRAWLLKTFREAGEQNSNNTTNQVWQQNNQPLQLERNEEVERVAEYIRQNPVKEGVVVEAEDYLYSSAYEPGLLRLEET
ncbi:MAG: transposase [Flavobacteriales bacterium]|nr:transposase [Flavobacteriales bacterium]